MRFLPIIFGILLLFGCTTQAPVQEPAPSQPEPQPQPEPPAENVSMTCEEYCPTQPHIQCVGQWDISGTYPDCDCSFVCDVVEENDTVAEPEPQNLDDVVPRTNKTLGEMLDEALPQIRSDFYRQYDGSYQETTYKWKRSGELDSLPGDIVFDTVPVTDIKFDGQAISSIQAAGLIVFDDGVEPVARGIAIFLNKTPVLQYYGSSFDVEYFHSTEHRYLEECEVTNKELSRDLDGDWVTSSYFSCMSVRALED